MELYAIDKSAILNNRYEILSQIGMGGFSVIYKAYDHELNSAVAIKEYFPASAAERIPHTKDVITRSREDKEHFMRGLVLFREEARRMAELGGLHNTVNVLGTFDENNTSYIVMELLEGMSLLDYLKTLPDGRFDDADDAKQIIRCTAEALGYAHSKKILHRDISPDNIFLCSDGKVKLIDFGAARGAETGSDISVVVKSGCTPPEQYRKNGRQRPWTDMYALGATFYRMLTGVYPASAPDRATDDPIDFPAPSAVNASVPAYIDALIMRCLAYDYKLRIARASEVMDVLRRETVVSPPAEVKAKRRILAAISYVMLAACAVLFLSISFIVFKKSESLYNIKIDECSVALQLPPSFTSAAGLAEIKEDFTSLYPQINIDFLSADTDAVTADIFVYEGDSSRCQPLDEISRLIEGEGANADTYYVTAAYDKSFIYLNTEKAFLRGIDLTGIRSADDITPAYYAETYADFTEAENSFCAYRGSVALYRDIQRTLPGMYKIYKTSSEPAPVLLSVSSKTKDNQKNAAMRFLLYLISERAQEIMFITNAGLIPAEKNQYNHFFEIYSELG